MIQRFIYVTLQKEFIHRYPDAPDEVSYLRYPHRHVAHIRVDIEVFHNEREIEFIMFKHEMESLLKVTNVMEENSCETIAESMITYIRNSYGKRRDIIVEVSEDGENGCRLICTKEA